MQVTTALISRSWPGPEFGLCRFLESPTPKSADLKHAPVLWGLPFHSPSICRCSIQLVHTFWYTQTDKAHSAWVNNVGCKISSKGVIQFRKMCTVLPPPHSWGQYFLSACLPCSAEFLNSICSKLCYAEQRRQAHNEKWAIAHYLGSPESFSSSSSSLPLYSYSVSSRKIIECQCPLRNSFVLLLHESPGALRWTHRETFFFVNFITWQINT